MLPMLTVSGGPGLVYLNGRLCGETGAAAMPLAPDGVQYLELKPFDARAQGAILRLRLENGRLMEGVTGDVFAIQWPGGWIAMEMRGAASKPAREPELLTTIEMQGGRYLLVQEGEQISFGRNAEEAVILPVEGAVDGNMRPHFMQGLCIAEGTCEEGRYLAVLRGEKEPEVVHCMTGARVGMDAQGHIHVTESVGDIVGHAMQYVWRCDAKGHYTQTEKEPAWLAGEPTWPISQRDTAKAFLEAIQLGAYTEATGYMAHPYMAEQMDGILSAFDAVIALPEDGSAETSWGLLNMSAPNVGLVRKISFTFIERADAQGRWKIQSMREDV